MNERKCDSCHSRIARPGGTICQCCSDTMKAQRAAKKQWCIENGICTRCKKNKAEDGKRQCVECNAKNKKELKQRRRENPEKVRAWDNARYQRDKEKRKTGIKKWKEKNKERVRELAKKFHDENPGKALIYYWRNSKRATLRDIKLKGCCKKCGETDYEILEFHHRCPEDKLFELNTHTIHNHTWEEITNEIAKCDILCVNCHYLETLRLRRLYALREMRQYQCSEDLQDMS